MAAATSGRLPLGSEVYLRSLTGRLVGQGLFKGFNRVAIIAYPDRICESIAAAAATAFLDTYGYGPGKVTVFDYEDDTVELAKKVVSWGPEAVYLALGGEQYMATVSDVTKKVIDGLRQAGFKGAILIHVRAWLATKQFSAVLSDEKLRSYLASLPEIRLFTADANAKKFYFHRVKVQGASAALEKYMEVDITDEHAQLLKLSLPPG